MKKIVIVAGDRSADIYGGKLAKELKKYPEIEVFSFGGASLKKNSHLIFNLLQYSVCGLWEVISHLPKFLSLFKLIVKKIEEISPSLIILMDFPDFNLKLAKKLYQKYPIFYYISPQVWAWRRKRINLIKKYVKRMIVLFEFEQKFYKLHGVDALYFGHPILEVIQPTYPPKKNIIALMPGSRRNEIKKHLAVMLAAKKIMEKELKKFKFCIIKPPNISRDIYKNVNSEIIDYDTHFLEQCLFVIASSGTATLELSLLEVPFLIIYKLHPISWYILKNIVKTNFVGMVNILSQKEIVKELLQDKATGKNIAHQALAILKDSQKYQEIVNNLKEVKKKLLPYQASKNFAAYIHSYLETTP